MKSKRIKKLLILFASVSMAQLGISQSCQNCGIGTSNPTSKLHIKGCTQSSSTSALNVADSNNQSILFVRDDKKVGVGTTSPVVPFHANIGHFRITDPASATKGMQINVNYAGSGDIPPGAFQTSLSSTSGEGLTLLPYSGGSSGVKIGTAVYTGSVWKSVWESKNEAGSVDPTLLLIKSGGKIGIGTSSPLGRVDIKGLGSSYLNGLNLVDNSNSAKTSILHTSGSFFLGTATNASGADASADFEQRLRIYEPTTTSTNPIIQIGDPDITITHGGNVGIGTSSPSQKLHFVDAGLSNPNGIQGIRIEGNGSTYYDIGRESATGLFKIYGSQSGANGFLFTGVNGDRLIINSSGNVGIGNTSPSYKLDVSGEIRANPNLRISSVGTGNGLFADDGAGSTIFSIVRQASNEVRFQGYGFITFYTNGSGGAERMRINGSGNIGFGTNSPNVVADINGGLATRPGSTVNITSDNQVVTVGNVSYLRLSSDNATGSNRTVVLTQGLQQGQILTIEFTGTNQAELLDDGALSGGGNQRMAGNLTLTQYDIIELIWNGTDWVETGRSVN